MNIVVKILMISVTLLFFGISGLEAQDLMSDIIKMNKAYAEQDFDIKMNTVMFYGDKKKEILKARVKKSDDSYWCKTNWVTIMQNKEYTVIVNEGDKSIIWKKTGKLDWREKGKKQLVPADLEKQMKGKEWKYLGLVNHSKHYSILIKESHIDRIELFLNKDNAVINKMVYHYNPSKKTDSATKAELNYEQVILDPIFGKDVFSHKQFMVKVKGKWQARYPYREYSITQDDAQ